MRCSLFDDADDVADAFCGVVFQKYVDMVLVCFHSNDVPVVLLCKIIYSAFYKVVDAALQSGLSVLRDKHTMHL